MGIFTLITSLLIIIYCLYTVFDIDSTLDRYYKSSLDIIDILAIAVILFWTIIEFFLSAGPVVLIPFIMMLFNLNHPKKIIARINHYIFFSLLALVATFILFNELTFNLNFWRI